MGVGSKRIKIDPHEVAPDDYVMDVIERSEIRSISDYANTVRKKKGPNIVDIGQGL